MLCGQLGARSVPTLSRGAPILLLGIVVVPLRVRERRPRAESLLCGGRSSAAR